MAANLGDITPVVNNNKKMVACYTHSKCNNEDDLNKYGRIILNYSLFFTTRPGLRVPTSWEE